MVKPLNWLKMVSRIVVKSKDDTFITNEKKNDSGSFYDVKGDGGAVFFGDGTEDEYQEMLEKESGWFQKLKEWRLK